jgi:hypothetical protein
MSTIATAEPADRRWPSGPIDELCRSYSVAQLYLVGTGPTESAPTSAEDLEFLVMFLDDDFGPYGSKLDRMENDLSGLLHCKVQLSSRRGVESSMPSPWREKLLNSARLIYGR